MILTKKHIGQLFDNYGGDGSWAYQLMDIKGKELLFYVFPTGKYSIDTNAYHDWRRFIPQKSWTGNEIKEGWESARKSGR